MPTLPIIAGLMGGWAGAGVSAPSSSEGGVYGYHRKRRDYAVTRHDLLFEPTETIVPVAPIPVEAPPIKLKVTYKRKEKQRLIDDSLDMIDLVGVATGEFLVEED